MNILKKSIVFSTLLLALGAGSARAEELVVVTVPFPFVVNGHTLPAGHYDVRTEDQDHTIVTIVGTHGTRGQVMVPTIAEYGRNPAGPKPALTFVRHENAYQLSAVWESSDFAREVARH
jgi:hypothetical protein